MAIKEVKDDSITKLKQSTRRMSKSVDGTVFLRHLMNTCGFKTPSIIADPNSGEINLQSTVYMESRRNIWLEIRKLIPIEYLNIIEQEAAREPVKTVKKKV